MVNGNDELLNCLIADYVMPIANCELPTVNFNTPSEKFYLILDEEKEKPQLKNIS